MANETNFYSEKISLYREATKGVVPTSVDTFAIRKLSFSLAEEQAKETNPTLGAGGEAPKSDYGTSSFSGNLECKYTGGIMPIVCTHVIGKATTKANATTDAWDTAIAYAVGDIVNHSDGLHSLVVKSVSGTGTSDATEPDLSSYTTAVAGDGETIVDNAGANQIVWIIRPLLKQYDGELQSCLESFGVESEIKTGCASSPVTFKERFGGLHMNSMELNKTGGTVVYKYSIPVVGMNRTDTSKDDYTALTVNSETVVPDDAFGYEDLTVSAGGSVPKNARTFRMMINRNTTLEDAVESETKIDNTPIPTVEGEVTLKFTVEEYTAAYENNDKPVVMTLQKTNGDKLVLTFPRVEFQRSPLTYDVNEPVYLTIPLNAYGDTTQTTVSYSCISATDY